MNARFLGKNGVATHSTPNEMNNVKRNFYKHAIRYLVVHVTSLRRTFLV